MSNKQAIRNLELALKNAPYGARYSFQELSTLAGIDVLKNRSVISCTNRHLLRHHQRSLVGIRGFGYFISDPKFVEQIPLEQAENKGYIILNVLPIDEENRQAMIVIYRELLDDEDAIRRAIPMDSAVIGFLRRKMEKID